MGRKRFRDVVRYNQGYVVERPVLQDDSDYLASGSANVLLTSQAEPVPFKGLTFTEGIGGIYYDGPGGTGLGPIIPVPPPVPPPFTPITGPCGSPLDIVTVDTSLEFMLQASPSYVYSSIRSAENFTSDGYIDIRFSWPGVMQENVNTGIAMVYDTDKDCAPVVGGSDTGWGLYCGRLDGQYSQPPRVISVINGDGTGDIDETYSPTDVYRIAMAANVVSFYKNGILLYTSSHIVAAQPIYLDVSINNSFAGHEDSLVILDAFTGV